MRIVTASASELLVPLREPFTIATARMDTTRAALIRIVCESEDGTQTIGLGEAACLYPVTREDLPEVMSLASRGLPKLEGCAMKIMGTASRLAKSASEGSAVLEAAIECALADAFARSKGLSVRGFYGGPPVRTTESDITIPIASEQEMQRVARLWYAQGFRIFKAKVGIDADREARALCTLHKEMPRLRFRLDANAGYSAGDALRALRTLRGSGALIECFEQPCARDDLDGMAQVLRDGDIDVVADESLRSADDLGELIKAKAASSVNLKLVKLGGFGPSLALGFEALSRGLGIMVGGMVETRLGMTCAATLAATLPSVRYADLDTAWLLTEDPFEGGFSSQGPLLQLDDGLGFSVRMR
jgi:L-Ala-D/L-Glu epimerase